MPYNTEQLKEIARQKARDFGLNERIFEELIGRESGWNPGAKSAAGAMGLGQLMPGTAAELGVKDPFDPVQNLTGSARYLSQQYKTFGDYPKALAAYNAGPGNVQRYKGIPPFKETQNYVKNILGGAAPPPPPAKPQGQEASSGSSVQDFLKGYLLKNLLMGTQEPAIPLGQQLLADIFKKPMTELETDISAASLYTPRTPFLDSLTQF